MLKTSVSVFWRVFATGVALLLVTGGWYACSVNSQAETPKFEPLTELPSQEPDGISRDQAATCVWPFAGLRQEPGIHEKTKDGENNYIIPIVYGERVELLDETVEIEKENRTYMKVRLKDGEIGWVHEYLFERYAILAAITNEVEIYRRPDLMTLREDKLEKGEIIVVIEDSMSLTYKDWLHVSNREKKKKGWIRRANVLSFSQDDVQLALRYHIAKQAKDLDVKKTRLEEILSDESFKESQLLDMVQEELKTVDDQLLPKSSSREQSASHARQAMQNHLQITEASAPVYHSPDSNSESKITELKAGDVCVVLEVGDKVQVGRNNDYWYKVQHEENEGWIHGSYTSRKTVD
ncbi:MAG: GW dipeptide domain-containing protein [Bacteroidota bacterium]